MKKNSDDTPQYFPIIIISIAQAVDLFFIAILTFYFFKIDFSSLPEFYLGLGFCVLLFNFHLYQIRDRKDVVLRKKLRLTLFFKIGSYFYFLVSLAAPLLLIYFINEYLM